MKICIYVIVKNESHKLICDSEILKFAPDLIGLVCSGVCTSVFCEPERLKIGQTLRECLPEYYPKVG